MKYPFVIFYRKEKYCNIDNFFVQNSNNLNCSVFIADNIEHVKNLHNSNFHLLITYGDSQIDYENELHSVISKKMFVRHIHLLPESNILSNVNLFNKAGIACPHVLVPDSLPPKVLDPNKGKSEILLVSAGFVPP